MEDKELRERLSRIEKHLGMEPYDTFADQKEAKREEKEAVSVQTVKIDRIGELLLFIEEKRQEVKEDAFLGYLKKMEEALCREQVKIDDFASNLYQNYEIYKKRHQDLLPVAEEQPVKAEIAEPEKDLFVPEPEFMRVQPAAEKAVTPIPSVAKQPAKKTDMEFGVGAVVLSIVGALFIIAALVTFGLNFMDNIQQGIFFYILAGVVIAFSELMLRKHLERFAQAITGIGVCVLYTATILNYLYLHTMNSVAALLATVVISVFALLLSRKRESASLRMIGILGCYISLMPLDKFESQTEFIIPCVILLIVNVIYLLLPVQRSDKAVRNVHSMANVVAALYLLIMAWISDVSAAWVSAFLVFMVVIQYAIYYGTKLRGNLKGFYVAGQILLHLLLAFAVWDESFYLVAAILLALVHTAAYRFYREMECRWMGLYCWTGCFIIVFASISRPVFLVGTAVIFALYKVLSYKTEELRQMDMIVSIFSAVVLISNFNAVSGQNMQYVLLAVFVLSIICLKYNKMFHEIVLMTVLWAFGCLGLGGHMPISIPLSLTLLLVCVALFTRVDAYRVEKVQTLVAFAWVYNVISLITSLTQLHEPNRISMTIVLLVETAILMLLFSESSGTKKENVVACRTFSLAFFLTYMVFAFGIKLPIAVSILLMLIAIASVSVGFILKIKGVRIYGLCMSFFVCAKLLLVDFSDAQSVDRVISFLVVGVIALAISYLYMRIERSLAEKENL